MGNSFTDLAAQLAEIASSFYARGWVLGTSGNFSAVVNQDPLTLAISPSGVDKGCLRADQILLIDAEAEVLSDQQTRPSDESRLHLTVITEREAGAVLHTHSVWSTVLSDLHARETGLMIEGYEMLKGLGGVTTHEHREWLPILDNSQDLEALASAVTVALKVNPAAHGFLVRRHGLYTWGRDLAEARRHVEILEFLLEALGRRRQMLR
jgi:methylthioribulose-1-phosphate dehydratase